MHSQYGIEPAIVRQYDRPKTVPLQRFQNDLHAVRRIVVVLQFTLVELQLGVMSRVRRRANRLHQ
jgi:hypothetical protein